MPALVTFASVAEMVTSVDNDFGRVVETVNILLVAPPGTVMLLETWAMTGSLLESVTIRTPVGASSSRWPSQNHQLVHRLLRCPERGAAEGEALMSMSRALVVTEARPSRFAWSCRAPFGAAPARRREPAQGQAECHTERSDAAGTYVVSDLD